MSLQVYVQLRGMVDFDVEISKLKKQVLDPRVRMALFLATRTCQREFSLWKNSILPGHAWGAFGPGVIDLLVGQFRRVGRGYFCAFSQPDMTNSASLCSFLPCIPLSFSWLGTVSVPSFPLPLCLSLGWASFSPRAVLSLFLILCTIYRRAIYLLQLDDKIEPQIASFVKKVSHSSQPNSFIHAHYFVTRSQLSNLPGCCLLVHGVAYVSREFWRPMMRDSARAGVFFCPL